MWTFDRLFGRLGVLIMPLILCIVLSYFCPYRYAIHVDMDVTVLVEVILASCILHNIYEARKNEFLPNWDQPEVMVEELALQIEETLEPDAEVIRSALTEYFNN